MFGLNCMRLSRLRGNYLKKYAGQIDPRKTPGLPFDYAGCLIVIMDPYNGL